MSEQENNSPRQAAVNALISWVKTGLGYYSMRDAVDNYLESCGANRPSIGIWNLSYCMFHDLKVHLSL